MCYHSHVQGINALLIKKLYIVSSTADQYYYPVI
uniref:DN77369_c0_g1_i1 n=1 Tax=Ceratitis capitata TaxID=7213 RepID=A0A6B7K4X7_CERCA|nr:DN77369_c0_g1_i1 [Ceratitis capitata]